MLPSLTSDKNTQGFFAGIRFDQDQPMEVLVLDKNTLTLKKSYQLSAGFVFHFGNAWEDTRGTINFDACLYPGANILHQFTDLMYGKIPQDNASPAVLFQLHPDGSYQQHTVIKNNGEFPMIDPQFVGARNRYLYNIGSASSGLWFDRVRHLDVETGKTSEYHYGRDYLVEENVFVNPGNKPDQGYLLCTALHVPSQRTCLNIFAANNIRNGPLCRAWLPYHLPMGFHGQFIGA